MDDGIDRYLGISQREWVLNDGGRRTAAVRGTLGLVYERWLSHDVGGYWRRSRGLR